MRAIWIESQFKCRPLSKRTSNQWSTLRSMKMMLGSIFVNLQSSCIHAGPSLNNKGSVQICWDALANYQGANGSADLKTPWCRGFFMCIGNHWRLCASIIHHCIMAYDKNTKEPFKDAPITHHPQTRKHNNKLWLWCLLPECSLGSRVFALIHRWGSF